MKKLLLLILFCPLFVQGQNFGNALHFDGANDYVSGTLPAYFANLGNSNFTVEAWVKPNGFGTSRVFFIQVSTNVYLSLMLNASGTPYVFFKGTFPSLGIGLTTAGSLPLNTWSHLAITWNATTMELSLYRNGVLQSLGAGGTTTFGADYTFAIGAKTDGTQVFNGSIDEFRFWSERRTQCQIVSNMHQEVTYSPNLLLYFKFNQGVPSSNNTSFSNLFDWVGTYTPNLNNFALNGSSSNFVASDILYNPGSTLNSNINVSACQTYTWINGQTYTSSTTDTYTLYGGSANGCDSTVTLNLTINQPVTLTKHISACESYTWTNGNGQTYTSSTTATHTLIGGAANGCDSTVTLNLTIKQPVTHTENITACESYTWTNGNGQTYTSSTTATHTLVGGAANGCDSTVTLNLTIHHIDSSVTQNGLVLTATESGASYQWVDCANGFTHIAGETGQSFQATANGQYAVEVSANGCTSMSDCIEIFTVGIENSSKDKWEIYPNPNKGQFTISGPENGMGKLIILTMQGQSVKTISISGQKTQVDIQELPKGIYLLKMGDELIERIILN